MPRSLAFRIGDQVVVRSAQGELTAQLKVNRRFPKGLVFVPENYRTLRLNSLMRRGEYPCPVEVQKAHAAFEIAPVTGPEARPENIHAVTACVPTVSDSRSR